uniref:Uncharacterized protein n=1 Tax=Romanomermis culicivorax TaxID=13658 RepID=A0A915HQX8_ROMCU
MKAEVGTAKQPIVVNQADPQSQCQPPTPPSQRPRDRRRFPYLQSPNCYSDNSTSDKPRVSFSEATVPVGPILEEILIHVQSLDYPSSESDKPVKEIEAESSD